MRIFSTENNLFSPDAKIASLEKYTLVTAVPRGQNDLVHIGGEDIKILWNLKC